MSWRISLPVPTVRESSTASTRACDPFDCVADDEQLGRAEPDLIPVVQIDFADWDAVRVGAARAVRIAQHDAPIPTDDVCVVKRDRLVGEDDIVSRASPERDRGVLQR